MDEDAIDEDIPTSLELPPNLSFVGTVNVDETTHAFSPKVLDRANVLEFNEVVLDQALGQGAPPAPSDFRFNDGKVKPTWFVRASWPPAARINAAQEQAAFTGPLADVHAILERFNRHFGYRVIDEVSAFVGHALDKVDGDSEDAAQAAFDLQLCQKVIPKLTGGRELEEPLVHLLNYCLDRRTNRTLDADDVIRKARMRLSPAVAISANNGETQGPDPGGPGNKASQAVGAEAGAGPVTYERAAKRLLRMLDRLRGTGFVSALE